MMQFLREIFDYLFPRACSYRKITDKRWVRVGARIGPFATLTMIGVILFSALLLLVLKQGIGYFILYIFFVSLVISLFLRFLTKVLRRRSRDPALILCVMMLFPLRGVLIVIFSLLMPLYMQSWNEKHDDISRTVTRKIEDQRAFLKAQEARLEHQHKRHCELVGNFIRTERERMAQNFAEAKENFYKTMEKHEEARSKRMSEFWASVRKFQDERDEQFEKNRVEKFLAFERRIGFGPHLDEHEKAKKIKEASQ